MKKRIISIKDGSFSYDEKPVLKDVQIDIYEKERIAVLGSNGSGKSTFFLCLNGVLKWDTGTITVGREEIGKRKKDRNLLRKKTGIVFQDADIQIIGSTVKNEIAFGLLNYQMPRQKIEEIIEQVSGELDLEAFLHKSPHFLSGGEKKKVTIADIIAMEPEILLMDEPASSLDCKNARMVEDILDNEEMKNKTVLIAAHDMDFVWRWADRAVVFHEGEIIFDGSPGYLFDREDLLELTHLRKPHFYQAAEVICRYLMIPKPECMPKEEASFQEFIKETLSRKG